MSESSSVRGILKKDSQLSPGRDSAGSRSSSATPHPPALSHSPKHLKWDETNLAETEASKSATMKITEPKTPYIYNTASDTASDDEQSPRGNIIPKLSLGSDSEGGGSSTHFSSSCEWESSEEMDLHLSPEERAKRKEQFRKMRKEHYRMKEAIRRGRALVKSESEASDSDG